MGHAALARLPHAHDAAGGRVWPVLRQPVVAWFCPCFLHVLAHVFIYIFFSLYLDRLGYGKGVIGAVGHRRGGGDRLVLYPGALAAAAGAGAVADAGIGPDGGTHGGDGLGRALAGRAALLARHAIGFAAHHTVCIALINRHFPRLRARGQALYSLIGYGCSGVTAGALGGWISTHHGLSAVFVAGMVAAAAATGAAVVVRRLGD